MTNIIAIAVAVLIFGIIVLIHELGHFLFARRNGIVVEEFAIGMGPKIASRHWMGTDFSIRSIPFGGFCRMKGEDSGDRSEGAFASKTPWQRFQVIFGGPLFNFLLAFFFAIIYVGMGTTFSTAIGEVSPDSPAEAAGLVEGDRIVAINGHRIIHYNEIGIYINTAPEETIEVSYKREGEEGVSKVSLTPALVEAGGSVVRQMGIYGQLVEDRSVLDILEYSARETVFWVKMVYYSLSLMVTGNVSPDQVSGPVGIVTVISDSYKESARFGFASVLYMVAYYMVLLSANLGIMNLLPIPALDGGRLIFILLEMVRGKPLDPDKEGFIHFIGYILLMALMVLILFNDIFKLF